MTINSKYELIIFDCDGTLVDSERLLNKAFSQVVTEMGYPQFSYEHCMREFAGKCYEEIAQKILEFCPDFPLIEAEEKFIEHTNNILPFELQSMPYAHDLLSEIETFPKCIASNGENQIVRYSIKITGLDQYFTESSIFTYEQVSAAKPAPDLFLYAAMQFNVHPQKCLVIEDSIFGVKAGVAAGMDTIGYASESNNYLEKNALKELGAKTIITDLRQILEHL
jgi:HAD superfamily hydrolase (TIGR01509 family)